MLKSNYFRYAAILGIICLAASGLLSVVFNITQPKILAQKLKDEADSLKDAFPQASDFKAVKEGEETIYYNALDKNNEIIGYCFVAVKKGYSSDIATMVGMNKEGVISRIKILSQNETPGLGTRIAEVAQKVTLWDIVFKRAKPGELPRPWFQAQFDGKNIDGLDGTVQVITGATISSRAVVDSVKERSVKIMEKIKNGR